MSSIKEKLYLVVTRLDFVGLLVVAFSLPLSESVKNIGLGIAFIGFVSKLLRKKKIIISPIGWGLILLILSGMVTTVGALDKSSSFKGLWDILRYSLIFFIAANGVKGISELKALQWGLLLSLAVGGVIGMISISGTEKALEIYSLGYFNHTGIYIAIMLGMAVPVLIFSNGVPEKILASCLLLVLIASLMMTTSRGSFVGFGASMVVILLFYKSPLKDRKSLIILLVFLIAIIGYFLSPLNTKGGSFSNRFAIWQHSFKTFQEYPVTGIGLNNYYLSGHEWAGLGHAHNLFVNTAVQAGTIGLVALMALILGVFLTLWKFRTSRSYNYKRYHSALWFSALGAVVAVIVTGMSNTSLHHEHGMLFTLILGMFVAFNDSKDNA